MHNLINKTQSLINTNHRKILLILFVIMIASFATAVVINFSANWLEGFVQRINDLI